MNDQQVVSTPDTAHFVGRLGEIPSDVIQHRQRYLYQTLDDLEALETFGDMLFRASFDQELAGLEREENYKAIGVAIKALSKRIRTGGIGAIAEEYDTADFAVKKAQEGKS